MTKEKAIKRDLISRAEVAEISEAMLKTVTDQKIKIGISRLWQQIKDLPSADRPRGEQYKKGFEDAKRAFLIEYARESQNLRKRNAQLEVMLNAQKAILADRPTDGDLISRAEAIEAVCDGCVWYKTASCEEGKEEWECSEVNKIRHLPSADRPRGHWKIYGIDDSKGRRTGKHAIICDRCLMKEIIRFGQSKWNFCPNCGADMRGEDE